ncbi:MAG: toxin-antitoxin system YwqK family antitoxin [Helicobacter sp.]|uniref:toxin-antitoxin system YwqK family antitoxin n=1 Tax=Helicobacter sp. TaxID=218 RepID=UPI002A91DBD9|nr:toxin-antitoxin system YwqK family antitoxin [Helicobacter sp.]MDY5822155.1 toxin-antitoxin system YwqK family antitoxin [Helicobacter sp.]
MLLKSVFIGFLSFSILHADTLKECKNEEDKISGCVERSYHSNGNLWEETPYKNGKLNGMSKWYYENGNLDAEISYKNDKLHGIGKWYYENGNIKLEITYKDSKREGVMKMYDTSGNLRAEVSALNNVLHGDTKLYTEDKKLFAIITNRYGETIFSKCLNGKVLTDKEIDEIDINDIEKAINYLQEICLKEGDSR